MLKSSGLSQAQAEAIVRVIAKAQESIATKHDINELKLEMSARFERIDGEMKLNRWMLGAVLASSSKKVSIAESQKLFICIACGRSVTRLTSRIS